MTRQGENLVGGLKAKAAEHGFADGAIARADAEPETAARRAQWLSEGRHGDMIWMEERAAQRGSPQGLWPEVRSVIMLGMSYAPARDPLALESVADIGRISVYAQGQDYHDVVKKGLKALDRWLIDEEGGQHTAFLDKAPATEKPLDTGAGWGRQGKERKRTGR